MFVKVLVVVLGIVVGIQANCTPCREAPKHYEELNCVGEKLRGDCCNSKYTCPDSLFEEKTDKCHLHGKWYNIGDKIEDSLLPSCIHEAKCVALPGGARIESVDKPAPLIEKGCVAQYTLENTCSPNKTVCDPAEKEKLAKCNYRGKEYHEGELFKMDSFSQWFSSACYDCICDANFSNDTPPSMNKNCRKLQCGIELLHADKLKSGCIPVYWTKDSLGGEPTGCCPIAWECPKSNEMGTWRPNPPTAGPKECVFDDKVFGFGQTYETGHDGRTCKCSTPPALTCIQQEHHIH